MKLAIVSDLHIGYPRFSEDAYLQATEALNIASKSADAILIAGDVFDSRTPKPEAMAQAINLFRTISRREWKAKVESFTSNSEHNKQNNTDVPIVAISGTHERLAEGKDNALNLLGLAGLLVDTSEATTVIKKNNERIAIFGFGGISEDRVKGALSSLSPSPVKGAFNVFMFHQSLYEILPFSDDFIKLWELPSGFDLYVNGHIHSRYEAQVHGKLLLIPGSTVITQLKDAEQEQKGFILFDTDKYSYEFVKINSRKFVSLKINADGKKPMEIQGLCSARIEQTLASTSNPIIRVTIEGTLADGHSKSELSLARLAAKHSSNAVIEIDSSKLVQSGIERSISELREGRIGEMSIKELGALLLNSRLNELNADKAIDYQVLFGILSGSTSKESAISEANKMLFSEQAE